MKIIITGGCGYVGTELTKFLLSKGHKIKVIDTQWFGNYHKKNKNLIVVKKDVRKLEAKDLVGYKKVIHLANIALESSEVAPNLSWEINVLALRDLAEKSVKAGVKQFIYASSGSVYGISKKKKVTESTPLKPISVYNKTKMIAERVILSYKNKMQIHCIRPATVSGYSDKMRLDLTVNTLTLQALKNKQITVFGGKQVRPNVNIKDLISVFNFFLVRPKIKSGCFNAGFENMSVMNIAKKVKKIIPSKIIIKNIIDRRHYYQDSSKLINLGFKPKFSIADSINDLKKKYEEKKLKEKINFYSMKQLKKLKIT